MLFKIQILVSIDIFLNSYSRKFLKYINTLVITMEMQPTLCDMTFSH